MEWDLETAKDKAARVLRYWNALCLKQGIERLPAIMYGSALTLKRQLQYMQSQACYFSDCWQKTALEELIKDAIGFSDSAKARVDG